MTPLTVLMLQSLLVTLQIANAGLATAPHMPPIVAVMMAAIMGGLQTFVQHVGNGLKPEGETNANAGTAGRAGQDRASGGSERAGERGAGRTDGGAGNP